MSGVTFINGFKAERKKYFEACATIRVCDRFFKIVSIGISLSPFSWNSLVTQRCDDACNLIMRP
jgi:hypothetical protein